MAIFKYEMRQLKWYIFWWSISLAGAIFVMLPVYMGFLIGSDIPVEMLSGNSFFDALGLSMKHIGTPTGVYGFLTSFMMIAAGINGMYLGLSIFTKECTGKTADFLMTKPHSRGAVFRAKIGAAACSCVIIGSMYIVGSFGAVWSKGATDFRLIPVFLIGLSTILLMLFFVSIGSLAGVMLPKIRTPLTVSAGTVFIFYIIGTFSRKTGFVIGRFLTPFTYFDHAKIQDTASFDPVYIIVLLTVMLLLRFISHNIFLKKDVLTSL